MPKPYPAEFRRRVLDLVRAGRTVTAVATDLGISDQTVYNWRRQERIDSGLLPGITSTDHAELVAARKRIAALEVELAVHRRAAELLKEAVPPKARFAAIATMTAEGLPTQIACRVLDVTDSGFYAWRNRPLSARALRHTWLSEQIRQIHTDSRGTYGFRRVHAELVLGRGITVGHNAIEMLMRRAGLKGLPGLKNRRLRPDTPCAADMVMISERPAEADDRAVPGHWEGDLIMGKDNRSAIGTLVERTTRFLLLLHLPQGRTALSVEQPCGRRSPPYPTNCSAASPGTRARRCPGTPASPSPPASRSTSATPHKPWQRGSNENTNGPSRQNLPKGTDLSAHTADDLADIARSLNTRPARPSAT